ncbi:fimbrial protein [Klebsiella sp. BIGb0407]|uniref:fimbrial protein n=1 Tax=Klebsiella sp. BIGb0407 TaxID=2940603 RepID=UPI0021688365|nr:fimbrial protein [Klebsiella sp. BIGb0407]MCS3433410.1 type 1 fimbria pilin [Klebsiella sp. BIGb0407]
MSKLFTFLLLCLSCSTASAIDVTVQVNGGILSQSCNVSSQDLIKNVNFPDLNPSDFSQKGTNSAEQPVSIRLENCTGNVNNVTYKFSGEADETDTTLLKIIGKGGASGGIMATGLAIEILDTNKKKIALNTIQALNKIITSTTHTLDFYLRYKSTSNDVGSGDASSIVYLDIYYE